MEVKIINVWFEEKLIFIKTDGGDILSRPLEAFPALLEATPDQRSHFEIGLLGDDIHWENLDEDIHISSFLESAEPEPENLIASIFNRFPWLNVSEVARIIGINKSLLSRYIYGIKKPSKERVELILEAIRKMGKDMASI
ncbi:MAG: DUF2442 domain-containing protein [Bacteroidales bacterium]|nr:DUF2442 domain-containing protein [Bacteroidales bacterium]